ncbi:AfsA-related hotdog domain-containing protein [Eionea flava]
MLYKNLLVVSDKFKNFAFNKDVITLSDLYDLINAENLIYNKRQKTTLILGQGINSENIELLLTSIKQSKNHQYFDINLLQTNHKKASKKLTHKHSAENILISEPSRNSELTFTSHLLIDEQCDMMSDHQTGLHVQGMLLVEAARQLYLAIMEKFILPSYEKSLYFVFNDLKVNYNRFNFPLPSEIKAEIINSGESKGKNKNYKMNVNIVQCETVCVSMLLEGTMMSSKLVSNMETKLSNLSVESYLSQFQLPEEGVEHA